MPEYLRHVIQIYVRAGLTGPSDLLRLQTLVVPSSLRRRWMQSTERRLSSLWRRSSRKKARLMLILTTVLLRVLPTARLSVAPRLRVAPRLSVAPRLTVAPRHRSSLLLPFLSRILAQLYTTLATHAIAVKVQTTYAFNVIKRFRWHISVYTSA